MTFYLDENRSPHVAAILRARGLDAVSAHEVGNTQFDDRTQLRYATGKHPAIVTCDVAGTKSLLTERSPRPDCASRDVREQARARGPPGASGGGEPTRASHQDERYPDEAHAR